jgi:hypothetical protein
MIINRQPTPTKEPIENGPEIVNFRPVLESRATLANRRLQPLGHLTLPLASFARGTPRRPAALAQGETQTLGVREISTCMIALFLQAPRLQPAEGSSCLKAKEQTWDTALETP